MQRLEVFAYLPKTRPNYGRCRIVGAFLCGLENSSQIFIIPISRIAGPANQDTNLTATKKSILTGNVCEIDPAIKAIANHRKGRSVTSTLSSVKLSCNCFWNCGPRAFRPSSGIDDISGG